MQAAVLGHSSASSFVPEITAMHPVVEHFIKKTQLSVFSALDGELSGFIHLGTMNVCENFMAIHSTVFEIFLSGQQADIAMPEATLLE